MRTRTRIAQNPAAPLFEAVTRPHRLVTELDAHGAIDRHATMCLKNAIEDALSAGAEMVVVDLRDLVSLDSRALALFGWARTACHGCDAQLGLLISGAPRHYAIVAAFNQSGLGEHLRFA